MKSFCQFLECQVPLHKRKAPHIEDFMITVLYQREVGFSSLVKIKPKYRNIMDDRLALSKIKPRISKPVGECCQEYSGHISALMFCAFLLRNSQ